MSEPLISASELAAALRGPNAPVVLDASYVLHKPEFDGDYRGEAAQSRWREGHIPGSHYVDLATRFSDTSAPTHYAHPSPGEIARAAASLGIGHDTAVVVYDSTATLWAARLWYLLRWIGVDVRVLDGGWNAWVDAGLPVSHDATPSPRAASPWEPTSVADAWITREELLEREPNDGRPLVCGLSAGLFDGTETTRYARRGHIPGSVNVPSRDLFRKSGSIRSAPELRAAYLAAGVTGDQEVLLYCGGGISAAANALALALIGIDEVRIYDGSLEEWAADAALPVV